MLNYLKNKSTTKKLLALALAMVIVVTGIGALFIDYEAKEAGFTVASGKIEIEMTGTDNLYRARKLTPLQEYQFTRAISNVGTNSAYVFMTVTIPIEQVYLTTYDGSVRTLEWTQLFTYGSAYGPGVNDGWTLVTSGTYGNKAITAINATQADHLRDATEEYGILDYSKKTITYIYAYTGINEDGTLRPLNPDVTTPNLFDVVKLGDVHKHSSYSVEDRSGQLKLKGYGIQISNLPDGPDDIAAIWSILGRNP